MYTTLGNLLYDSVSPNTGDIAIGLAGQQAFAELDVRARIIDPFEPNMPSPLIVGGGELIRVTGDPFYDSFRQRGRHILNAAGVWSSADDLDYLREYAFVSARSQREVEVLRKWVPDAEVVPCATTILKSDHFEIPGVEQGEPLVGIHMVPHSLRLIEDLIPLIDAIPYKKVFIPFTHYNSDASFMKSLPFDRTNSVILDRLTPLQLHSVIGQMKYVTVSSLHASIFAYSQNVPFISVHQKKAEYYFADRGLIENLVKSRAEFVEQLNRLEEERPDYSSLVEADQARVRTTFLRYRDLISDHSTADWRESPAALSSVRDVIMLDQAQHVIGDRDLALSYSESRRLKLRADANHLAMDLSRAHTELDELTTAYDLLRTAWWVVFVRETSGFVRRTFRQIAAVFKRS
ncbi:polysaccharide pyruvyl transferase family protein [Cryobacterium sp. TMT2-15-1]|uniref:polysaccharide pyruvyl transferase family protein n=1 Tax=Cryobacterium sp. TMT2-15-1 TaxID=1259246 RepID=UPI00106ADB97|nr:polysaccharide pyruvyl transferase family protein [Cryobacterium sp. TMT2-15-1]TFC55939.1 polysaccharide pyruvyl transferase family protein [Cryobacterium sp. TMT2-15-1]